MGIKEDVEQFENKIAKLKVDYEQYFVRVLKREPAKLREELDKFVLNYSNKNISNTQYKFRLNTAVAKYNSYRQYWNRTLRDMEEGRSTHRAEGGFMPSIPEPTGNNHSRPAAEEPAAMPQEPSAAATPQPQVVKPQPPVPPSGNGVEEVYRKFIEARKQCNEPTEGITMESLSKSIAQTKKLIEEKYKTSDVELKVLIKDGKAKLTIVPKK